MCESGLVAISDTSFFKPKRKVKKKLFCNIRKEIRGKGFFIFFLCKRSSKAQPVFPEDESTGPYRIYFNEHVAQSNLKVVKTDPKFLAVTGKALGTDEKFFEVTVRMNPEYDPATPGSKEFQTVNATQISKKTHKVTGNTTASGAKTKTKVDLSTYTIVPYMSPHVGINSDRLVEETTEYFRNYNLNGITGNVNFSKQEFLLFLCCFCIPWEKLRRIA